MRRLVLLLLLCAAVACAFAAPAGAGQLVDSLQLSATASEATAPLVEMGENGDSVAVWKVELESGEQVVQAAARPAGGSWSAPMTLSAPAVEIESVRVAIDGSGNATAGWNATGTGVGLIQAATYTAGVGWGPPKDVSGSGAPAVGPALAEANGRAIAVWARKEGASYVVQESVRAAGAEWTPPIALSPGGGEAGGPSVAMDAAGEAVAGWEFKPTGQKNGYEASSLPVGAAAWSTPQRLNLPSTEATSGAVGIGPTGSATAVWSIDGAAPETFVAESASRGAGGIWSPSVAISPATGYAVDPLVAVNATGEATAIWHRYQGGKYRVEANRRVGASWSGATEIAGPCDEITGYAVGLDTAGQVLAVVGCRVEEAETIKMLEGTSAGTWSTLAAPSPSSVAAGPTISVSPAGDAVLGWQQEVGGEDRVFAEGFDGAGPQLRSLTIPTAATVGQSLAFSVSPFDVWSAVTSVDWDFSGAAGRASGTQVTHAFPAPGDYAVTVTATDAARVTSTARATVHVAAGPPAPPPGSARSGRVVPVKGKWAFPRLACPAGGSVCSGTVRLTYAVKAKKRSGRAPRRAARRILLGQAHFQIAAGTQATVRVKLSRKAQALLGSAPPKVGLRARLEGTGITARAVVLKAAVPKRRGSKKGP